MTEYWVGCTRHSAAYTRYCGVKVRYGTVSSDEGLASMEEIAGMKMACPADGILRFWRLELAGVLHRDHHDAFPVEFSFCGRIVI
jgi:hypothetical protein